MKTRLLPLALIIIALSVQSCYKNKTYNWDRGTEPGIPKAPLAPIIIDTDGDGIPDFEVEISHNISSDKLSGGSSAEKVCFNNSANRCNESGGLYYPEVVVEGGLNKALEDAKKALDTRGDGKMDKLEEIIGGILPDFFGNVQKDLSSSVQQNLVDPAVTAAQAAATAEKLTAELKRLYPELSPEDLGVNIGAAQLEIVSKLEALFNGPSSPVLYETLSVKASLAAEAAAAAFFVKYPLIFDEEMLQQAMQEAIAVAVQHELQKHAQQAVEQALITYLQANNKITEETKQQLIESVSQGGTQNIAADIILQIAKELSGQAQASVSEAIFNDPAKLPVVRGACPEGWHIPSDREWKQIELALGMPATEVHLSGIKNDRGASADMAAVFSSSMALVYGGYGTEDGKFAQYGEVDVFISSTVGQDEKGPYVWGR
jgi:uncharacterized protein (TIGR02145 family)